MRAFSGLSPRKLCFRENALIPGALPGVMASPALCAPDRRGLVGGIWFKQNGAWPVWMPAGIHFVSFRRKLQETILQGCKIVSGVQRGYPSGLRDFAEVPSKLPAFYKPVKHFSGFLKNRLTGLIQNIRHIRRFSSRLLSGIRNMRRIQNIRNIPGIHQTRFMRCRGTIYHLPHIHHGCIKGV
jgi:hypothetical protein